MKNERKIRGSIDRLGEGRFVVTVQEQGERPREIHLNREEAEALRFGSSIFEDIGHGLATMALTRQYVEAVIAFDRERQAVAA